MPLRHLLEHVVAFCHRHARSIVLASVLVAALSGFYAANHLAVSTNTDDLFAASLPWRQRAVAYDRAFPQFRDLLVAVIDAHEPEQADATAAQLAKELAADDAHFLSVTRPDASPFLRKEGLLFLDTKQLSDLLDSTIDAQPFIGQLVADPTARGLFSALALIGIGVSKGDVDL
ncbi:MAG TPA: RND transporter, partial [bacterium]|nr:RND transporter [bacterium]